MAVPGNLTTVPIRWTGVMLDGTPASGFLVITCAATRLTDAGAHTAVLPSPLVIPVANGTAAAFSLIATDEPDINPSGFTYSVREVMADGSGQTYAFSVPAASAGAGIDLPDVAPVGTSSGTAAAYLPGDTTTVDTATVTGNITLGGDAYPKTYVRTLSGNVTITSVANMAPAVPSAFTVTVLFKQASAGGPYTVTWPASLEWPNDALAPTMPTTANAELLVHLFWTGTTLRAIYAGTFFP